MVLRVYIHKARELNLASCCSPSCPPTSKQSCSPVVIWSNAFVLGGGKVANCKFERHTYVQTSICTFAWLERRVMALKVNKFSHFQKNLRKKREKKYTLKRHIRKMKMSFPNHLSKDLDRRTFCSSDAGRHHFKMNTFFIFLSCVLTNTLSFHIIVHLSKEKKKDENGKTSCFMSFHKKKDELRVPL